MLHFEVVYDDLGPNIVGAVLTHPSGRQVVMLNSTATTAERVVWTRGWLTTAAPEVLQAG